MTTIANALSELGITEWVLRGEPTTENATSLDDVTWPTKP